MKRREFIALLGGTALAWPFSARAQQPGLPVVGFISGASPDAFAREGTAFRKGLNEAGAIEGQNMTVEYHWLEGQNDRLPVLVADLVRRKVAVIASLGNVSELRLRPKLQPRQSRSSLAFPQIQSGWVLRSTSLARPGGNATGVHFFFTEVLAKRLRLLHDLVPKAVRITVLVNPSNPTSTDFTIKGGAGRRSVHGLANPSPQRHDERRDRCGLCHP